jgi:hypothetical protein
MTCRARLRRAAAPFDYAQGRLRSRALLTVGMVLSAPALTACPVCFGGASGGGQGMNAAIFFLLAIVGFVQIGFVALFWSFWRRAKELRRRRESFHLLEGGVR